METCATSATTSNNIFLLRFLKLDFLENQTRLLLQLYMSADETDFYLTFKLIWLQFKRPQTLFCESDPRRTGNNKIPTLPTTENVLLFIYFFKIKVLKVRPLIESIILS